MVNKHKLSGRIFHKTVKSSAAVSNLALEERGIPKKDILFLNNKKSFNLRIDLGIKMQ